jgi:putative ABC transport system permease protein
VVRNQSADEPPQAYVPITWLSDAELAQSPPQCLLEAPSVEAVAGLKAQVEDWLELQYGARHADFQVQTYGLRVEQTAAGFRLFRIVMGLIVGISVLVGGIGVMNVLLISVNERTSEIGLRKALGAKKSDILRLFLAESVTVSTFGSLLGLALGTLGTAAFVPLIRALTAVPFQAAYTWNTLFVISAVAVAVGIVFGTYPAMKAARLDPVEAIRVE